MRLLQTVGYKNFKDNDCLNEFLHENRKEIKSFKILKEAYNGSFEELLQDVMERANYLGNMIEYTTKSSRDR